MICFAHALLLVGGHYVLQLHDDKPGIGAPGMWSLFGGRVEEGEEPQKALLREIREELCLQLETCRHLWTVERYSAFAGAVASYCFFEADISELWDKHRLTEGQAVGCFCYEELSSLRIFPLMRQALEQYQFDHGE